MADTAADQTLSVVVAPEPTAEENAKGLFRSRRSEEAVVRKIPVEDLQRQLNALTENIAQLVDGTPADGTGGLRLTQLSVQVEITASGGINLIGTANVGAAASLTLGFSR